jgi:hypothetical protein
MKIVGPIKDDSSNPLFRGNAGRFRPSPVRQIEGSTVVRVAGAAMFPKQSAVPESIRSIHHLQ